VDIHDLKTNLVRWLAKPARTPAATVRLARATVPLERARRAPVVSDGMSRRADSSKPAL